VKRETEGSMRMVRWEESSHLTMRIESSVSWIGRNWWIEEPSLLCRPSGISSDPLQVGQKIWFQIPQGPLRVSMFSFYMKTWTLSEVLQGYVTPSSGVHDTHYFCGRPFMGLSNGGLHICIV